MIQLPYPYVQSSINVQAESDGEEEDEDLEDGQEGDEEPEVEQMQQQASPSLLTSINTDLQSCKDPSMKIPSLAKKIEKRMKRLQYEDTFNNYMRRTESSKSPMVMTSASPSHLLSFSKKATPRSRMKKKKKRTASSLDSSVSPALKGNRIALEKKKTYDFTVKSQSTLTD